MSVDSKRRYRRITAAITTGILGKGTSLLVNAAVVPLTVNYLGGEGFGLWVTIVSTVTMFFVLDIGIANTLTNLISQAYAKSDEQLAAEYFATAFWLILGIAAVIGFLGILVWPLVHWSTLLGVQTETLKLQAPRAIAASFIVFLIALPAGLAARVLAGYQELHVANLFTAGGSLLSLASVLVVERLHGDLVALVAAYAGSAAAANVLCLVWIVSSHKPWLKIWPSFARRAFIGDIFHSGSQFFFIQIAGLVVFNSDNLIISHYLSPSFVTPYNITWRIGTYIAIFQLLAYPALWPAYSEAYARGDLSWIRSAYVKNRLITIIALLSGCSLLLFEGQSIIRIWAGPAAVPPLSLVRLMAVWVVIYAITTNQSCLMGATGHVKKQAFFSLLGAVANFFLSIHFVKTLGISGVLFGTIASYLLLVVIPQTLEVRRILRGEVVPSLKRSFAL